jgi:hypothetical protein
MKYTVRMRLFSALYISLCACSQLCPSVEPLNDSKGNQLRCVQSADCPRPSNVLVCAQAEDKLRDCIACESSRCVRHRAKVCE